MRDRLKTLFKLCLTIIILQLATSSFRSTAPPTLFLVFLFTFSANSSPPSRSHVFHPLLILAIFLLLLPAHLLDCLPLPCPHWPSPTSSANPPLLLFQSQQ